MMSTKTDTNVDQYNEPHTIVLIFERSATAVKSNSYDTEVLAHETYYKALNGSAKSVYYGEVMNERAVCAIIQISGAAAFEQIIGNDPALKSGLYQVQQVIPFMH